MPRPKKGYSDDELLPAPDIEAFKELLQYSEYPSIHALSMAVTASGDGNLIGRALARERRLKLVEAVKIAEVLNMPIRELLKVFGYDIADLKVPVCGKVYPNGSVLLRENPTDYTAAPTEDSHRLNCVVMYSADTPLAAWDRFGFFYEPHDKPAVNAWGRLAIVKPADAKRPYLGVMPRATGRHATLIPFMASDEIKVSDIEWSAPVLWIKCTG